MTTKNPTNTDGRTEMKTEHTFWAICDTDGGRHTEMPMCRHIYSTEQEATQAAQYRGFDSAHYPIRAVSVEPTSQ